MNDFEYEVRSRKGLARMSRYRKCGSKSKKCSLSTDNMSKKQWKERCGEVQSCSLNKPMGWKDFKRMPISLQKEYIYDLVDRYNTNATRLGEMFGVTAETVRKHLAVNEFDVKFKTGNGMNRGQKAAWSAFLTGDKGVESAEADSINTDEYIEEQDIVPEETEVSTSLTEFTMSFEGRIDASMIANSIGKIEITCILNKS